MKQILTRQNCSRVLILLITILSTLILLDDRVQGEEDTSKLDYSVVAGQWQRTDSSRYMLKVSNVMPDGLVTVEYFNPKPIHVENSSISTQKGLIKLFIELRDKMYDGSTYTLYYFEEKDALVGFYFHALSQNTYEVIFLRKSSEPGT